MRSGIARLFLLALPILMASCALHFPREKTETQRLEVASRAEPVEVVVAPDVPVLMFADELHTGLILKLAWLKRHGYVPPPEIGDHQHVVFSWGDETAYVQERWLSPWQVFDALLLPLRCFLVHLFGTHLSRVYPHLFHPSVCYSPYH